MKKEEVEAKKEYVSINPPYLVVRATGEADSVCFTGRVVETSFDINAHPIGFSSKGWLLERFKPVEKETPSLKTVDESLIDSVKTLLKGNYVDKITFVKSGKIKAKFSFIQNKVTFDTIQDLLNVVNYIQELNTDS